MQLLKVSKASYNLIKTKTKKQAIFCIFDFSLDEFRNIDKFKSANSLLSAFLCNRMSSASTLTYYIAFIHT